MNDNASQSECEHRSRSFNRCLLDFICDGGNGEHPRQESFFRGSYITVLVYV